MSEREHTLNELRKMEMVRNYLLDNGIVDADGIKEETL
jgi:biotin synthase-related radical SAM superfamily protein